VVAHTLSVVTFQAGVGRKIGATRPAEALLALRAVEVTGRSALEELRRILGPLRDDDGEAPSLVPAPGVGDLEDLAGTVRAAGIPVSLAAPRPDEKRPVRAAPMRFRAPARMWSRPDAT
jgi:signal transduction histidine kinase